MVALTASIVGSPGDVAGVAADAALGADLAANLAVEGGEAAATTADVADAADTASTISKGAQAIKIMDNSSKVIDAAECAHDFTISGCSGVLMDGLGADGDAAAGNVGGHDGALIKGITDYGLGGVSDVAGVAQSVQETNRLISCGQ